jgi:hypothetical protein
MPMLAPGFQAEVRNLGKDGWHKVLEGFDDASLYQTWSYEVPRRGAEAVDHLVLRDVRGVVAAAQIRLMRIPKLRWGVAYVPSGPLWKPKGQSPDPDVLRQAIRALRNEYALRRGMLLRIFPVLFEDQDRGFRTVFLEESYREMRRKTGDRTLILDVRPDIPDLRKNLHQKWRNGLNQAEKRKLEVIEGVDDDLFEAFTGLYRGMVERKKFRVPNDIREFRLMQSDLPDGWKMRIFLCRSEEGLGAGAICSAMGNRGIYLFGATNPLGLANKGSYLLQWRIIQWLKAAGCACYDLNGIDPVRNPGTYRFKAGIAGTAGRDVAFLGRYDSYSKLRARFLSAWADRLLRLASRLRAMPRRQKGSSANSL